MNEIEDLKKKNDAVILAHYYTDEKIQKYADYVGDSFYLAQTAQKLTNQTIVMSGVYFMGESIKILNPHKTVLMVDSIASCPMVAMVDTKKIEDMRSKYDDLAVVCYINSTAKVKAHADVCVTSSNALKIVEKLKQKNIYFIPDGNLGGYISRYIKDKNFILNEGYCPSHNRITADQVMSIKNLHPKAKILAHPECRGAVVDIADYVGSTSGIIGEAGKEGDEFIIVTEIGISTKLKENYPDKTFYFIDDLKCCDMKLPTMEKLIETIKNKKNEVIVDSEIAEKALVPLQRMLELGAN